MVDENAVQLRLHPENFLRLDVDIGGLSLDAPQRLVDHDPRVGEREALAPDARGQQQRAHRNRAHASSGRMPQPSPDWGKRARASPWTQDSTQRRTGFVLAQGTVEAAPDRRRYAAAAPKGVPVRRIMATSPPSSDSRSSSARANAWSFSRFSS